MSRRSIGSLAATVALAGTMLLSSGVYAANVVQRFEGAPSIQTARWGGSQPDVSDATSIQTARWGGSQPAAQHTLHPSAARWGGMKLGMKFP